MMIDRDERERERLMVTLTVEEGESKISEQIFK